jgi:hypothetical protein
MKLKRNTSEEVMPGRNYSFWADMKVNGWLMVAAVTTFFGDSWPYHHKGCPDTVRAIIALIPLPISLLWIRSAARWIRGMDESQRRITTAACLFASTWTLVVVTLWQRLNQAGTLEAIFGKAGLNFEKHALTGNFTLSLGLIFFLYFLANAIVNRRYK